MGAGISKNALRSRLYRGLKKVQRQLTQAGVPCDYRGCAVRGANFVAYYDVLRASNGECCAMMAVSIDGVKYPGDEGVQKLIAAASAINEKTFTKGQACVILGYKGDGVARDVLVDDVKDNRVIVWDRNRKTYRAYLFQYIGTVVPVKE
jgi:hypothetical protein